MNSVNLIGRITAKPEIKYTPNTQTATTTFTIAVDRYGKDKGADFIRLTAFGKRAETICRYMDKGRMIAIQGRIQTGSYKDRDGKTVYTTDVIINEADFIGKASEPSPKPEIKPTDAEVDEALQMAGELLGFNTADDDIPF